MMLVKFVLYADNMVFALFSYSAAFLASVFSTAVMHPIDTIKIRLMSSHQDVKLSSCIALLSQISFSGSSSSCSVPGQPVRGQWCSREPHDERR